VIGIRNDEIEMEILRETTQPVATKSLHTSGTSRYFAALQDLVSGGALLSQMARLRAPR